MVVGVASPSSVDQPEIGLGSMEQEEAEALEDALAGLENEGGATAKQTLRDPLPRENAPARFRQEKPALNAANTATPS
jgi:hypothetical protein